MRMSAQKADYSLLRREQLLKQCLVDRSHSMDSMDIGIYGRQKLNSSVFAPKTMDGLKRLLTQKTTEMMAGGNIDEEEESEDLLFPRRMETPDNAVTSEGSTRPQRFSTYTSSAAGWCSSVMNGTDRVSVSNIAYRGTATSDDSRYILSSTIEHS